MLFSGNYNSVRCAFTCELTREARAVVEVRQPRIPQNENLFQQETRRVGEVIHRCFTLCGNSGFEAMVLLDPTGELGDLVVNGAALLHQLGDLFVGIHDRGVVSIAEELSNFRQ